MPNHCSNTLIVTGQPKILKIFKEKNIINKELDFNGIAPMPEGLRETESPCREDEKVQEERRKKYGAVDWYEWALKNWGTKWNAYDQIGINEIDKNTISFYFTTAWCPAEAWFHKLAEAFPSLKFTLEYEEPGMMFAGIFTAENGEVEHEEIEPNKCEECGCIYFGDECYNIDEHDEDEE